jgi:uncharacterized repeat protein (TIGR02543 family)
LIGYQGSPADLQNNYAYQGVSQSNTEYSPFTGDDGTGLNGKDISCTDLSSANFWENTVGLDPEIWNITNNAIPTLADVGGQTPIPYYCMVHITQSGNGTISNLTPYHHFNNTDPSNTLFYTASDINQIQYQVTPSDGYLVKDVYDNDIKLPYQPSNIYTLNSHHDHSLTAEYIAAEDALFITATDNGFGGTIEPKGTIPLSENDSQTFNFIISNSDNPKTHYYTISDILIDGVALTGQTLTDAKATKQYTFSNITTNHTIYVSFSDVIIPATIYTVTFNPNGGKLNSPATVTVPDGNTVNKPKDPSKQNYTFVNWYSNSQGTGNPFNFASTPIESNITLYAKWQQNVPKTTITKAYTPITKKIGIKKSSTITIPVIFYGTGNTPVSLTAKLSNKKAKITSSPKTIFPNKEYKIKVKAGKKTGKTKLTISADGKKLTLDLNITKSKVKAKSIKIKYPKKLRVNKTYNLSISTKNIPQYSTPKYTIASKYKRYISIDKLGKITAKKKTKSAIITVKVFGKKFKIKIKVD